MEEYTPGSFEAVEAPSEKKSNTTLIIIIVAVVLLLCCCCVALVAAGWFYGDRIIEQFGQAASLLLAA